MKDRLNSLYRHSPRQAVVEIDEIDLLPTESFSKETDEFLHEILVQRQAVVRLRDAVYRVSQLHCLLLAALDTSGPDVDAVTEMIKTLDSEFQDVDATQVSICRKINELKGSVESAQEGVDLRVRRDQLRGLTESLRAVLLKFSRDYVDYEESSRRRALEYSQKRGIPETEEERVLDFFGEGGEAAKPQLQRTISVYDAVLKEVIEKHATVERVELAIEELGRLFHELRIYVDVGNNMTNHIQMNIETTGEYVEKGRIETGISLQKKEDIKRGRGWLGKSVKSLRLAIILLLLLLFCLFIILFWMFFRIGLRI